jgi:hypothetical protein
MMSDTLNLPPAHTVAVDIEEDAAISDLRFRAML